MDEIFTVDLTLISQIDGEDFVNFCGLLWKHELYSSLYIFDYFRNIPEKHCGIFLGIFNPVVVVCIFQKCNISTESISKSGISCFVANKLTFVRLWLSIYTLKP